MIATTKSSSIVWRILTAFAAVFLMAITPANATVTFDKGLEGSRQTVRQHNHSTETEIAEASGGDEGGKHGHGSRIADLYIPLQTDGFPQRPRPILEFGQNFLETGTLSQGINLPTGAVWQPYFIAFGTYRTGLQSFDTGIARNSEWANRYDLFGNLYLTFTERILIGFRPLDRNGRFTGVTFSPEEQRNGFQDEFNFEIRTLFFEGDFGEIFPNLDKEDKSGFDYGFSVGRQNISFQEGMLINDNIDAVGITKINWKLLSAINFRWTLLYGWNQLNRTNLPEQDESSSLFGLLTEADWRSSTVAFDAMYVMADDSVGSGIQFGLSAVQRVGNYNTSFRVLGSIPVGDETLHNSRGALLFAEISSTPHGNHNLVYLNAFLSIENFRSTSRDPSAGGPLGRTGILFAAVGLSRYDAPLSNSADEAFGGSLGYQMFFSHTRRQLILEIGGRYASNATGQRAVAAGGRYQIAFGRRWLGRVDGFVAYDRAREESADGGFRIGGRLELLMQF